MMDKILKEQSWQSVFLKLMIIVSLCFPVYMSKQGSSYYPWFVFSNVFVVLFLIISVVGHHICIKRNRIGIWLMFLGLLAYNIFGLYINHRYLGLYGTQMNISIAILLFIALISLKNYEFLQQGKVIDFLIKIIVISNLIGIFIYLLGYNGISFRGIPELELMDPNYYERRFNWIYLHKSQYALMLVVFVALFVTYRERFRNKGTYFGSLSVLMMGLIISHTYTSLCAVLFIFGGQLLDYMKISSKSFKFKYILYVLPVVFCGGIFVFNMAKERNIWNLGGRIPIWLESVNILKRYPCGIGSALGTITFSIPNLSFEVTNCHNFFLNQMLCFSIKVGLCFIFLFVIIIMLALKQKISFLTIGIWISLLIPLNMDYALTPVELPLFLLIIFFIFWKSCVMKSGIN